MASGPWPSETGRIRMTIRHFWRSGRHPAVLAACILWFLELCCSTFFWIQLVMIFQNRLSLMSFSLCQITDFWAWCPDAQCGAAREGWWGRTATASQSLAPSSTTGAPTPWDTPPSRRLLGAPSGCGTRTFWSDYRNCSWSIYTTRRGDGPVLGPIQILRAFHPSFHWLAICYWRLFYTCRQIAPSFLWFCTWILQLGLLGRSA